MIRSACGLDCPDACEFSIEDDKIVAHTNNGTLCSLLNREFHNTQRIENPTVDGVEVSMEEALDATAKALGHNALLWRGSGNFGVMQEVTNLLFSQINGTLTKGSLCDGAGEAGIEEGRGVNHTLSLDELAQADVVIVWGRNISTTNSHLMPYLEGKKIVVIDPVRTAIAKRANLHIQIAPRSDIYLALILSRFIYMEDSEDTKWMDEYAPEYEEFYDFTRTFRIKAILEFLELSLGDMGELISYLKAEKVVILTGLGVQKYSIGSFVLQAIDALAVTLGLFARDGCGVGYLGNSKLGFDNPFAVTTPRISKVTTPFSQFKTVLVQGGNPAESMPHSSKVRGELEEVENLIYFGLYANETSKRAKIVIPAKSFFEKDDVRLSYGHHRVSAMNKVRDTTIGISEYLFTFEMYKRLGLLGLEEEQTYINTWLEQCEQTTLGYRSPAYKSRPYATGFGEDGEDEFVFIDDFDDDFKNRKKVNSIEFWLITPKAKHSLNTQFRRDNTVGLHPDLGYAEGDEVMVKSSYGEHRFIVKHNSDLRMDSILITANTMGVNFLTPDIVSEEGEGACYQEVKVLLELLF